MSPSSTKKSLHARGPQSTLQKISIDASPQDDSGLWEKQIKLCVLAQEDLFIHSCCLSVLKREYGNPLTVHTLALHLEQAD